ncbi:hypothetical protein CPB84DRAFT_188954 [Gymnopilus junonius]|uniref:Uncharacterized protein n=1 Tax=Gymnopilus junonius TaxID=109634 RepID=A0A9P5NFQ7_GYMJU|nr:hypothetical protein CPB84DRAFT_188954 [Gymnopilus junonius]
MQRKSSSKTPAERAARAYDVQDALLAIRLRVFLKAQGVSEDELVVRFPEEEEGEEEKNEEEHQAEGQQREEQQQFGDEIILAERSRHAVPPRVPIVSSPSSRPLSHSHSHLPSPSPSQSQPQVQCPSRSEAGKDRPIRSSPPPLSPIPSTSANRTMPSASYMIALIKMRKQQSPARSCFRSSMTIPALAVVVVTAGVGMGMARGSREGQDEWVEVVCVGRCCWRWEGVDGYYEGMVEEVEEEFDSDSVADWYAGLDY